MKQIIKKIFGVPDKRKGTLACESFFQLVDDYIYSNNKDSSKVDYPYLMSLYIAHKDDEIRKILSNL